MRKRSRWIAWILSLVCVVLAVSTHRGLAAPHASLPTHQAGAPPGKTRVKTTAKATAKPLDAGQNQQIKTFDQTVRPLQRLEGLFTLYRDRTSNKLLAEIQTDQLNTYFLCASTLESGLGEQGFYSGLPLATFLFYFRPVNNTLQLVAPNVHFRTRTDDPLKGVVRRSFSESVLAALPVKGYHPTRKTYLVELDPTLLSDFSALTPEISAALGSPYTLEPSKSYLGQIKPFPLNIELESIYNFTGGGADTPPAALDTVPDSRTFNLRVRYSLSQLPKNTGYRPRYADERIGYFITAFQNLSDDSPDNDFVRYINRWHLEKQDPTAPLSPPKQPIVFWIENTVPPEYREAVRDGVLMWNQAFEKIGFKDAIQIQQMPNNATWDPADIRYNTIRWMSSFNSGILGIGPLRANPLTGEILDADVLIDSGFIGYIKRQYRTIADRDPLPVASTLTHNFYGCADPLARRSPPPQSIPASPEQPGQPRYRRSQPRFMGDQDLCFGREAAHQFAMGHLAMTMMQGAPPNSAEVKRYVQEFLRELIAHEVGHTLGLRHNFRGSTMLSSADLNNVEITHRKGLVGSVMDYNAVNIAPDGVTQGDYFSHVVGPYDEWAIAYGYTPSPGNTLKDERDLLDAIAHRAPEPDLAYGTDEDADAELDPQINIYDLSSNLLTYAPQQLEIAQQLWQKLDQHYPKLGGSFNDVRKIFDEILHYYFSYARFLPEYVGGESFNRYKSGDAAGRLPFEPIPVEQQRQALILLAKYVFDPNAFRFSPNFLNKLAPSRWDHWGTDPLVSPLDYPLYDRLLRMQTLILDDLLDFDRLERLRDADLKAATGKTLTLPELFATLQTTIWGEVYQPSQPLHLSSLRRGLQRVYLNRLGQMVLRKTATPDDARTLAWYNLKQLNTAITERLQHSRDLDAYSKAHFEEASDRIHKILDAQLITQ